LRQHLLHGDILFELTILNGLRMTIAHTIAAAIRSNTIIHPLGFSTPIFFQSALCWSLSKPITIRCQAKFTASHFRATSDANELRTGILILSMKLCDRSSRNVSVAPSSTRCGATAAVGSSCHPGSR